MTDRLHDLEKEVALLYRVAASVHSLELEDVLKEIVAVAVSVTGGDSCFIYTVDRARRQLVLRASKNPHDRLLQKITMSVGEGITGWVAREAKPVVIEEHAAEDKRFKYFRELPEDRFEAFLSVPILSRRGVVGVINIQHRAKHVFTTMEINLLTAVGKLVGGAVENALLVEETLALKEALELRKLIDKAKGILMKRRRIPEDEAYKLLQSESMNSRKSLHDVAEAIIMADKLTSAG